MRPAHAELLAEDLDEVALVQAIDRYLMWYVRTADRLERTATWQRKLPGGMAVPRLPIRVDLVVVEPPARPGSQPRIRHHRDALAI